MMRRPWIIPVFLLASACTADGRGAPEEGARAVAAASVRCAAPSPPAEGRLRPLAGLMGRAELAAMKARYAATQPDPETDVPTDLSKPFARAVKHMFEHGWPAKAGGPPPRPISTSYVSAVAQKVAREGKPPSAPLAMPWGGAIPWHAELVEADSREAYRSALAWAMTGKAAYADVVKRICGSWRASIPGFARIANDNAPLEVGWAFGNLVKALLVLEHGGASPALSAAEKAPILAWIDAVAGEPLHRASLLPADPTVGVCAPDFHVSLKEQTDHRERWGCPRGGVYFANWQTTMLETRLLLSLFRGGAEGRAAFDADVGYALVVLGAFTAREGARAMTAETCRDVFHAGFGIAGLVEMAELAWQQGDPRLYEAEDRILKEVVGFHAKINRGVVGEPEVACDPRFGGLVSPDNVQPYHEVALHHYEGRLGLAMQQTRALVENGPRDGDADGVPDGEGHDTYSLQWGYGTITHRGAPCE